MRLMPVLMRIFHSVAHDGEELSARIFRVLLRAAILAVLSGSVAAAETIAKARYTAPVERYGHFALGRPHEYARVSASTSAGRKLELQLPENEVFEDLAPRLVKLAPGEPATLLAIVSRRDAGSRLVLIGLNGGRLAISAQSAAIGTQNRWLNPVGAADLDGDGRAEIAAVITPHIGGTLKLYRRQGADLIEIAALAGFSNHVYGTSELALSMPLEMDGHMRLLVPDATRLLLRIVSLQEGRLVETGRCALSAPVTGPIEAMPSGRIAVGLASGRQVLDPGACLR